jgi:hypothetical protein
MAEPKTYPVRVLVREVGYTAIEEDAVGNPVSTVKYGLGPGIAPHPDTFDPPLDPESQEYADALSDHERGQIIYLLEDDYNRHMKYGVIRDLEEDQELEEKEADEELLDPRTASVEDLERWIREEKPTVNDVVQASDGDPEVARKLLEAETQAQDGEPRKGVVDGLSVVIGRG